MIPKASQRGGGQQLATHLLNAIDNERVEILDVRGAIANDLHGAFAEWEAAASATKCRKYLYSLSINPDPQQRRLSREEIADFIARAEKALGLADQPRALVCHVKDGREHFHVAWSRIDTGKMRAVQLSHDRQKLRAAVREFARDRGLELPHGMKRDDPDRFKNRPARSNHAEKQQEERTGITKEQRQREITALWHRCANGAAFAALLAEAGYTLAQGDKRGHVIVDRYGEIHSLSRQVQGVKAKHIKIRMADFPPEKLPPAQEIQKAIRQKTAVRLREVFKAQAHERRTTLERSHQSRRALLDGRKLEQDTRHRAERAALLAVQRDRNLKIAKERRESAPRGLPAFLGTVTGITAMMKKRQSKEDAQRTKAQRDSIEQLTRRQERERRDLARQYRALGRVEKRETRSFETKIKREFLAAGNAGRTQPANDLRPAQECTPEQVRDNARDITTPPAPRGGTVITDKFAEALKQRAEQKKHDKERKRDRDRGPER